MPRCRILVAGDDAETCESLAAGLRDDGHAVDTAPSACGALERARHQDYDISILDFPSAKGFETLEQIRLLRPQCFFISLTPAVKVDAEESAGKPCSPADISVRVSRIVEFRSLRRENTLLREQLARHLEPRNNQPGNISAGMTLNEMESVLIAATIQHTHGNIKEAASVLGIDRSTLYEKIRRYRIPREIV